MKKLFVAGAVILSFTLLFFNLLIFMDSNEAFAGSRKVTICHYPPGDPDDLQTISISENAVSAHLKHGDALGECPSGCQLNASMCDDGNLCTSDSCLPNGECEHSPVDCNDGNPCTLDRCEETSGCLSLPDDGVACDDGNACTENDTCVDTVCAGQAVPDCCIEDVDCDDGDLCSVDSCIDSSCANVPVDCAVVGDLCVIGLCDPSSGDCMTTPVVCDDANACTDDLCAPATGCYSIPTNDPPEEVCADGIDNDCDGMTDYDDEDCSIEDFCLSGSNPGPQIETEISITYWSTLADYNAGILSVDYDLVNYGSNAYNNVLVVEASATGGVTIVPSSLPEDIGDIPGGSSAPFTLKWQVPAGISFFGNNILVTVDGYDGPYVISRVRGCEIYVPPPPAP